MQRMGKTHRASGAESGADMKTADHKDLQSQFKAAVAIAGKVLSRSSDHNTPAAAPVAASPVTKRQNTGGKKSRS